MSFIQILLVSWKTAFRNIMISVLLWAFTALTAMPVFRVVHRFLNDYFGMTLVGTEWLREFDLAYFLEFIRNVAVFQGVLSGIFFAMLIIYYMVTVWTTGGVIGSLNELLKPRLDPSEPTSVFKRFSSHGGRLFGRYFRLSILTFSMAGISLIPAAFGIAGIIASFLLMVLWIIVSDVTKTIMSVNDTTHLFRSYFMSFRFVVKYPLKLSGLYAASMIAVLAGFILYTIIDQSFTADTVPLVVLLVFIQQIWIWWRALIKVQLFASVMAAFIPWNEPAKIDPEIPAPMEMK